MNTPSGRTTLKSRPPLLAYLADPRGLSPTPDPLPLRGISPAPQGPLREPGTRRFPHSHRAAQSPAPNPTRNPQRPRRLTFPVTRPSPVVVSEMEIIATASPRLPKRIGAVLPKIGLPWVNLLLLRLPLPRSPVMRCLLFNVSLLISRPLLRTKCLLPTTRSPLLSMLPQVLAFLQTHLFSNLGLRAFLLHCQTLLGIARLHPLEHPLFPEILIRSLPIWVQ